MGVLYGETRFTGVSTGGHTPQQGEPGHSCGVLTLAAQSLWPKLSLESWWQC